MMDLLLQQYGQQSSVVLMNNGVAESIGVPKRCRRTRPTSLFAQTLQQNRQRERRQSALRYRLQV